MEPSVTTAAPAPADGTAEAEIGLSQQSAASDVSQLSAACSIVRELADVLDGKKPEEPEEGSNEDTVPGPDPPASASAPPKDEILEDQFTSDGLETVPMAEPKAASTPTRQAASPMPKPGVPNMPNEPSAMPTVTATETQLDLPADTGEAGEEEEKEKVDTPAETAELSKDSKNEEEESKKKAHSSQEAQVETAVGDLPDQPDQTMLESPAMPKMARARDEPSNLPDSFKVNPNRNPKIVGSMAESFLLETDMCQQILDEEGEEKISDIVAAMMDDSISTAFSGIEAAGVSLNLLRKAFFEMSGCDQPPLKFAYQIEWSKDCLNELLPVCRAKNICLFQNIVQPAAGSGSPRAPDQ